MKNQSRVLVPLLIGCLVFSTMSGCNTGSISSLKTWVVEFATATGNWVKEKAETFGKAVAAAWSTFWGTDLVGNVKPDANDPLRGIYDGVLRFAASWGKQRDDGAAGNRMEISLDHPNMVRKTETSTDWELAPDAYRRLKTLQESFLSDG